jgi:hypothetical protein
VKTRYLCQSGVVVGLLVLSSVAISAQAANAKTGGGHNDRGGLRSRNIDHNRPATFATAEANSSEDESSAANALNPAHFNVATYRRNHEPDFRAGLLEDPETYSEADNLDQIISEIRKRKPNPSELGSVMDGADVWGWRWDTSGQKWKFRKWSAELVGNEVVFYDVHERPVSRNAIEPRYGDFIYRQYTS